MHARVRIRTCVAQVVREVVKEVAVETVVVKEVPKPVEVVKEVAVPVEVIKEVIKEVVKEVPVVQAASRRTSRCAPVAVSAGNLQLATCYLQLAACPWLARRRV